MDRELEVTMDDLLRRSPSGCRTIAFASGKGGVGTSVLALNTALLLARSGKRVAILDGDFGLAGLTVLLGRTPKYDLGDVLAGTKRLEEIILRGPNDLLIIPAGAGVEELADISAEALEILFKELRVLRAGIDYLLIDTPTGIGRVTLDLVRFADETIVVTRPEPTALSDAYGLMKIMELDDPSYPVHVLVNMALDGEQARQVYNALTQITLKFVSYRMGYAGFVTNDPNVGEGVIYQIPFVIRTPTTQATRDLHVLIEKLVPEVKAPRPTFWERVSQAVRGR